MIHVRRMIKTAVSTQSLNGADAERQIDLLEDRVSEIKECVKELKLQNKTAPYYRTSQYAMEKTKARKRPQKP